ncbi:hypothetical protein AOLI_G00006900 [Acnodon oligacanthus]
MLGTVIKLIHRVHSMFFKIVCWTLGLASWTTLPPGSVPLRQHCTGQLVLPYTAPVIVYRVLGWAQAPRWPAGSIQSTKKHEEREREQRT